MTATEVLSALIDLGVVVKLDDSYHLTDMLERLHDQEQANNTVILDVLGDDIDGRYPESIVKASRPKKVEALLNHCEVPVTLTRGTSSFMVRSSDKSTLINVLAILKDPKFVPEHVIACIKDYYKFIEYPKAFKRFIVEDFGSLYHMYAAGKTLLGGNLPDNHIFG